MRHWIVVGTLFVGLLVAVNPAMGQTKSQAKSQTKVAKKSAKVKSVQVSEKDRDIKRLLDLSGSGALAIQVMTQLTQSYRTMMPGVPHEFWDEFLAEADADSLVLKIVPIYAKHYTHDEIKELIVFYESPMGKKMVAVQPQIVQESQVVGGEWGAEIGALVMKRLAEKGYQ